MPQRARSTKPKRPVDLERRLAEALDQPAATSAILHVIKFRQVGPGAATVEGTGLGLSLARRFVELHGGTLRLRSEVGRGSTFTFTLPLPR